MPFYFYGTSIFSGVLKSRLLHQYITHDDCLFTPIWECLPPTDTTSGSVGGYAVYFAVPTSGLRRKLPMLVGRWKKLVLASRRSEEEFPHLLVSKEDHFSCCDIRRSAWGLVWKEKHCLITSYRCRGSGVMSGCLLGLGYEKPMNLTGKIRAHSHPGILKYSEFRRKTTEFLFFHINWNENPSGVGRT